MLDLSFAEIYRPGAIFLPLTVYWSVLFNFAPRAPETAIFGKLLRYGRSGSAKLVLSESSYAISYQSFIVTVCLMPIFCRFRDITIYWSKPRIFLYPTDIHRSVGLSCLGIDV